MKDNMRAQPSAKLPAVQWARAIAAVSVAIGHSLHEATKLPDVAEYAAAIKAAIPFQIGVDIFFVISGFIMVYVTHGKLGQPGFAVRFARDRLLRIVPLYWFFTLILAVVALLLPQLLDTAVFSLSRLAHSLLFFPGLGENSVPPLLRLGWTLNYEMFFYAAFFLSILCLGRWALVALMIGFSLLAGFHLMGAVQLMPFRFWGAPLILEFCFGMVIGLLFLRGIRVSRLSALFCIAGAVALLVILLPGLSFQMRFVVLGLPLAVLVAALALLSNGQSMRQGVLSRLATRFGDASYSLYLLHPFVIAAMFIIWRKAGLQSVFGGWGYLLTTILVIMAASLLVCRFVERPLTSFVKSLVMGRALTTASDQ